MACYSIEPKTRTYDKGYGFLWFSKSLFNKYEKKLLDTATTTGLDAAKPASKKGVHKTALGTEELIRNKIVEKIMKPKPVPDEN